MECDATEKDGKIYVNGSFKIAASVISGVLLLAITILVGKVDANEKHIVRLQAQYESIKTDLNEIKNILRRTAPYERRSTD